jgi:hypothetical protein
VDSGRTKKDNSGRVRQSKSRYVKYAHVKDGRSQGENERNNRRISAKSTAVTRAT